MIVGHGKTEEILYAEVLTAGHVHVYTADGRKSEGRASVLVDKS